MASQIPDDVTRVLVLEGAGDVEFFGRWLEHLGDHHDVRLVDCKGKDNLKRELINILNDDNLENLKRIGIIRDNDFAESRESGSEFEQVIRAIEEANMEMKTGETRLPVPDKARSPKGDDLSLSVLMLPSDDEDGMLETLILDAIGPDATMQCTDEFFRCLADARFNIRDARLPRSKLSVYISGIVLDEQFATNDDSRRPFVSQVVNMKWWRDRKLFDHKAFCAAKEFLQQLLSD